MPEPRVRTVVLLALLGASVPDSAIRKLPFGILVCFRHLLCIYRRGEGWVAVRLLPVANGEPNNLDEREFTTIDEALTLLEALWPMSDELADEIVDDPRHSQNAQLLDDLERQLLERLGRNKEGSDA